MNLAETVRDTMPVLAILPGTPKDVASVIKAWTILAVKHQATPEEFETCVGLLLERSKFFPTPSEFIETLRTLREERSKEAESSYLRSLVLAIDGEGNEILVPRKAIDGKRYVFADSHSTLPRRTTEDGQALLQSIIGSQSDASSDADPIERNKNA